MTDEGPQFRYDPLPSPNDIRLLEIFPSDNYDSGAVTCSLVTKSLDSGPVYIALSYTWGTDTGREHRNITCNGSQVRVTKNLYYALQRLRLPTTSSRGFASNKNISMLGKVLDGLGLRSRQKNYTSLTVHGRRVDPTGSVSDVLAHFLPGPLYLWADAICIDQSNIDEKSIQVAMMDKIYQQATLVVVDLGALTENTKHAMETMPGWKNPLGKRMDRMKEHDAYRAREKILAGFTELFLQPWFSRVWVFQEVVLAKEVALLWDNNVNPAIVMYGVGNTIRDLNSELRYEMSFTEQYRTREDVSARAFMNFRRMIYWNHMLSSGNRPKMLDILQIQMDSRATDGRDKIYAYLGVAREFTDRSFEVSYSEPTSQTYYRFACRMLVQEKELRLLHLVTGEPSRLGLPSWVPNFSSRSILRSIGFGEQTEQSPIEGKIIFGAGGTKDPEFQVLTQFRELRVLGLFYDTIAHVGRAWRTSKYLEGPVWTRLVLLMVAAEALEMARQHCVPHAAGKQAPEEVCWRTLVCDSADGADRLGPATLPAMRKAFICLKSTCLDQIIQVQSGKGWDDLCDDTEIEFSLEARKISRPFLAALEIVSAERRFSITKAGRAAFVPAAAEVGDHICVLQGMPTPFAMRRDDNAGAGARAGFLLVGEAYVHGIMDGEALLSSPLSSASWILDNISLR